DDRNELLWHALTRDGPKPRPGTPAHHDGDNFSVPHAKFSFNFNTSGCKDDLPGPILQWRKQGLGDNPKTRAGSGDRPAEFCNTSRMNAALSGPVLVTGAAGFIGYHVARRLLEHGRPVVGLDNFSSYYDPKLKR